MRLFNTSKKISYSLNRIDFTKVKAVIFDVDGTLYNQKKLRLLMLLELLKYYLINFREIEDIKILKNFRQEREKRAFELVTDLENAQYYWAAKTSGVSWQKVHTVVQKWIYQVPLKYLPSCRYPGILEFFDILSQRGIATGIFSDYPAQDKLDKLGLFPDYIVSATDRNVDRLKPDPKGLFIASQLLGVPVENCLFIGDRDERDGECARQAGMPYLILDKSKHNTFFLELLLDFT